MSLTIAAQVVLLSGLLAPQDSQTIALEVRYGLATVEASDLTRLIGAGDLREGGHVGLDERPTDGMLETIRAPCELQRIARPQK